MKADFAERYGHIEQWHWWFRGRQRILETVLHRTLAGRSPLAIASLGCGPWQGLGWLEPFASQGGRIVGVDAERLHARGVSPRFQFAIGRAEALPLAARSFDVVLALDVLEHLDDDVAGLREAALLTRPGGLLLVTVPALPILWGRQDVVSHHRRRYTRRNLLDAFARACLPAPRVTYFNTFLVPPIACIRLAPRALGSKAGEGSDFDDTQPGFVNEILAALFAAERHLVPRVRLPIGVSLLAIHPSSNGDA